MNVRVQMYDGCDHYDSIHDTDTDFVELISFYMYDGEHDLYEDDDLWDDAYSFIDEENIGKSKSWYDEDGELLFTLTITE